jgi:hypothetical protein
MRSHSYGYLDFRPSAVARRRRLYPQIVDRHGRTLKRALEDPRRRYRALLLVAADAIREERRSGHVVRETQAERWAA